MQLHGSLQDFRQGDESMTQFMQKAKALFDELAATGRPVSLEDFDLYVFRGLRGEFKDLVTSLVTKAEPLSYADLHSHLPTHEFIHKSSVAIHAPLLPTPNTPPSTLVAQRQTFGNSGRNRGRFNGGWHPNQFSSRGNQSACSRLDHRSFHSSSFGDSRQGNWQGNWQRNRGQNPRCQLCQNFCHIAPHCPQLQQRGYGQQPIANLAQCNLSSTGFANWFPDTGANQHVTPDLATLTAAESYLGNDNLHVGDGKGLPISHLGHIKIYTPHRSFTLTNVLHVPAITKPLLSDQKFYVDNNVYFEFHPRVFYINDLNTNEVLLSGKSKDGLYALTNSSVMSVPQAYWSPCTFAFADLWHRQISHPTSRIFQLLV